MASATARHPAGSTRPAGSSRTLQATIALAFAAVALPAATAGAQQYYEAAASDPCFFRSTMYGEGAASCQNGQQFRCDAGSWIALGAECSGEVIAAARSCWMSGNEYPSGVPTCHEGLELRCDNGVWRGSGAPCGAPPAPIQVSSIGESCRYEAIAVSTGSSVCQTGTTYLCNDGQWMNMGTLCR